MKKYWLGILFFWFSIAVFAQNNLSFVAANESYNKGDYQKAIGLYEQILKTGNHSANLYFNLANCYYKLQKIAPSIYNYEKALSLDPNNSDILTNYGYAKQARLDHIETLPKGFLMRFYENLATVAVDFWAWLAVICVILFVVGFVLFYRSYDSLQRKVFFGIWSLSITIAVGSLVLAFVAEAYQKNTNYAIVFSPEIGLQSEPNLRSEQLLKLHEGTKVQILEEVDNWEKIKLTNGQIGWLPKKDIRRL